MSTIEINGLKINYIQQGMGWDIVCLHGWRQNIAMMQMITDHFQHDFRVTVFDFPGFGESDPPKEGWSVQDYADFLADFLAAVGVSNPILVGHSFGCRVAVRYAAQHPVHKMVFTGAAGIRPKRGWKWYVRTYSYKVAKVIFALPGFNRYQEKVKSCFGSDDYRNSSGVMRETTVKVVNDDITDLLPLMTMPTLLVWGDQDEAAPLWMGKMMEEKMPNAGLAIFEGEDHYAYWHQWDRFNRCLDIFLKEEKENHDDRNAG